jgi:WXG100 family type VII secretion target
MAGQFRITPDQMRSRAGEFKTQGAQVNETITKMQGLIDALQSEWEGSAATAFASQFSSLKPSFIKMKDLIDDIARQLEGTASAVEQMDQEIANKFKV